MKSLKGIGSFVAVVSTGSFAAAARAQGVSAVAVSKNVATLERQLGIRLLQRTTRKMNVTAEGATFYQQCLGPLRELESAQSNVQRVGSEIFRFAARNQREPHRAHVYCAAVRAVPSEVSKSAS